ncbi:MAG: PD40 domain-containing protein [Acidobacteriota bacterium]|nr:MAG: PD40 domain-containing protein [Acidobacteriota bacterium]
MIEQTRFIFGEFELDTVRRRLLKSGEQVPLSSRAVDLLIVLIERHGAVLSKDELFERVWPGQFVEENNLSVQISAIRKALGDNIDASSFIITVPGTGYGFVADVAPAIDDTELVIESHTRSTVIVEEHIEEDVSYVDDRSASPSNYLEGRRRPMRQIGLAAAALMLVTIFAGGYAFRALLFGGSTAAGGFSKHKVRQLTTNGKVGRAALSPDGKMFVYTIDDLGKKSLWLGYVAGGNHLQLLEPAQIQFRGLTFSPNSESIYFSTVEDRNSKSTLYKIPASGGPRSQIMTGVGRFSISPDGERVAYTTRNTDEGSIDIMITGLNGSETEVVTSVTSGVSTIPGTISWSPDGKKLAFSRIASSTKIGYELVTVSVDGLDIRSILVPGLSEIATTIWGREGNSIIVTAREKNEQSSVPQYHLWNVALPNGELSRITTDRSNYGASWHNDSGESLSISSDGEKLLAVEHRQVTNIWVAPISDLKSAVQITDGSFGKYDGLWGLDWSPDGRLIYTTSDTQSQFLARINPDGSDHRPLTAPGKIDSVLTVTNDGRYVLFHSNRGGEDGFDIWRMDIDGSNIKQLTFGGQGFQPTVSGDGKWVYYISIIDGSRELARVSIDGGDPESIYKGEVFWPSASPDGRLISIAEITERRQTIILSTDTHQILYRFGIPPDATHFMGARWTPDGRSIVFRDLNAGYWIQPLDSETAIPMEGVPSERLYNFAFSKDGGQFAFVRGRETRDVVLLEPQIEK